MLPAMDAYAYCLRPSAVSASRCVAELDAEVGAGAGPGRDANRAAEAFDDVLGDGEAEAGAGAAGGEVWIEDPRQIIVGDADAGVADRDRRRAGRRARCGDAASRPLPAMAFDGVLRRW